MAIYRGEGGKTDVVPADGDQEFAGSIIAEKDIHAHGNISADGDITIGGDIHWEGTITGDGSGLENVPTPFLQADDCIYLNNQVITNDYTMPVGKNGMTAGDVTVNGELTIPDGSDWHVVGTEDGVVTLESLGIPNHDLVTVDETGHLTAFNVTSESPYVGDGSLLTGIPTVTDLETITTQVETNTTNIQTNADAIQANTDAIEAIPGAVDAYTKAEIDAQQDAQDTEINKKANTTDVDAKNALQDAEIDTKITDAPNDGEQYVRKDGVWSELEAADGGIADAPADGKTYGRKDHKWEEVTSDAYTETETDALLEEKADKADTYTKAEIDVQQDIQDDAIKVNTTDIATNTADIAKNKTDIEALTDDIDALTGSIIYKGSLNATVTPAPADAVEGDMWINEYNVDEPATNYPVASGWAPVTEVKYDDKLIKTDTGWDLIASVVGVPSYTAGEIDALLDDKADKGDSYLKAESDATNEAQDVLIQANADAIADLPEPVDAYTKAATDTLLDSKANVGDSYTKAETYSNVEIDGELFKKADKTTTYTKTEVDSSQALQNTEIAKKANQATTYTKDEVDELLENASGAIVGNYTNKQASNVARDPGVGNLYLANGMNFSTDYNDVTSIYISDTDGDGDVRDFDEVKVDDKITLTSENGSGEYTVFTISDVGGYRELVVDTESATGTIADDTAVSIVLDVASSETGGGIEEAPEDGKQYARQDGDWTEVEATSGGGGVEAQPPVGFEVQMTNIQPLVKEVFANVLFDKTILDTENAFDSSKNAYVVKKAGLYQINFRTRVLGNPSSVAYIHTRMKVNGTIKAELNEDFTTHYSYAVPMTFSQVLKLEKDDELTVELRSTNIKNEGDAGYKLELTNANFTSLSGHMVSSITEGEVKEKEAVVFNGRQVTPQTFSDNLWTKINLDKNSFGEEDTFLIDNNSFKPNVAGYYQLNAQVALTGPGCANVVCGLGVNGTLFKEGLSVPTANSTKANMSYIKYFDGVNDSVDLMMYKVGGASVATAPSNTYLSAHLITGQSSGGGSDTTREVTVVDTAIGMVAPFAMDSVPTGWLHCDGSEVSRDTYSLLYSKVGDLYGAGDGSTTFNLPNLQDEFIRGSSDKLAVGNKQGQSIQSHTHSIFQPNGASSVGGLVMGNTGATAGPAADGSGETRPRNVAMLYCINATAEPSSGGGSYTPEKMVWEDKLAERGFGKVETNDNDVPLYVQIYTYANSSEKNAQMWIGEKYFGAMGNASGDTQGLHTNLFVIPAHTKYELRSGTNASVLKEWHEAKMPVAVGTGGKTVAFSAHQSSVQSIPGMSFVKMNLDTVEFDTDNCFSDSRFTAKVPGYYQVNGQCGFEGSVLAPQVLIYTKDGSYKKGNVADSGSWANVSSVIYLNEGDWIELHFAHVNGSEIKNTTPTTDTNYFSAVLVSGGSASGDSIWTEEDGNAVLETDGKKLTIDANVGELGLKSRITTDASTLELKAGSGGLPDVTIADTGFTYSSTADTNITAKANSGRYATYIADNGDQKWAMQIRVDQANAFVIRNDTSGQNSMTIGTDGEVAVSNAIEYKAVLNYITKDQQTRIYGKSGVGATYDSHTHKFRTSENTGDYALNIAPDGRIDINGSLFVNGAPKSVDSMLADLEKNVKLKDKLIEKLSARLDKLEKRIK